MSKRYYEDGSTVRFDPTFNNKISNNLTKRYKAHNKEHR